MHFTFILVEPKVAENIGASARAIKTMGFESLRMVKPCEYLSGKASWVAHGSIEILENAEVFNSLAEAVADMDIVIGTTARYRWIKQEYKSIRDLKQVINEKKGSIRRAAIVFGREESGLTNEELRICDLTTSVPLKNDFPSLNLSQAVMLYAYELSDIQVRLGESADSDPEPESVRALRDRASTVLELSGISKEEVIYGRIIERLALAGDTDIKLMHSVSAAILKKLSKTGNKEDNI